jgi:hypothetical protein
MKRGAVEGIEAIRQGTGRPLLKSEDSANNGPFCAVLALLGPFCLERCSPDID